MRNILFMILLSMSTAFSAMASEQTSREAAEQAREAALSCINEIEDTDSGPLHTEYHSIVQTGLAYATEPITGIRNGDVNGYSVRRFNELLSRCQGVVRSGSGPSHN